MRSHSVKKGEDGYEEYLIYMKEYMLDRYNRRMIEAREYLGGICIKCGVKDNLDIHHKNPELKEFTIGTRMASAPLSVMYEELDKCELLCRDCHIDHHRQKEHGTLAMYRYCKCDECREFKSKYSIEYNKTHLRKRDRNKGL